MKHGGQVGAWTVPTFLSRRQAFQPASVRQGDVDRHRRVTKMEDGGNLLLALLPEGPVAHRNPANRETLLYAAADHLDQLRIRMADEIMKRRAFAVFFAHEQQGYERREDHTAAASFSPRRRLAAQPFAFQTVADLIVVLSRPRSRRRLCRWSYSMRRRRRLEYSPE